jgi:hypothetical protein
MKGVIRIRSDAAGEGPPHNRSEKLEEQVMRPGLRKSRLGILGLFLIITTLLVASPAQAFRFVVLADSPQSLDKWPNYNLIPPGVLTPKAGINKELLDYIRDQILALKPKPDMVFFLGDLVTRACYPNMDGSLHYFLPDWKDIMRPLPQNGIKVYVAVGNRDLYGPEGWPPQKDQEAKFRDCFSDPPDFDMPDNGPPSYKKLAYSFTYDNAFFVVLDTFGFKDNGTTNWDNGLDTEQLNWFRDQAQKSEARFKFVLTHGPAFSPEGYTVDTSMRTMWQFMEESNFTAFYCGHEHIFSRWLINKTMNPTIIRPMTQTLVGTAGAYPDDPSSIKNKDNIKPARIWLGYNFAVVDVERGHVTQKAYGVTKETGEYKTRLIDICIFR